MDPQLRPPWASGTSSDCDEWSSWLLSSSSLFTSALMPLGFGVVLGCSFRPLCRGRSGPTRAMRGTRSARPGERGCPRLQSPSLEWDRSPLEAGALCRFLSDGIDPAVSGRSSPCSDTLGRESPRENGRWHCRLAASREYSQSLYRDSPRRDPLAGWICAGPPFASGGTSPPIR